MNPVSPPPQPKLIYDSASGVVIDSDTRAEVLTDGAYNGPVADDGRDLRQTGAAIQARVDALAAQLNEHTFDPATGAKVYAMPEGSEERRVAQRAFAQVVESAKYEFGRLNQIAEQRDRAATDRDAQLNEEAAKAAFAKGDPSRAAALAKALQEEEARQTAAAIVRARRAHNG
jgi:hypothetical protein